MLRFLRRFSDSLFGAPSRVTPEVLMGGFASGLRILGTPELDIEGSVVLGSGVTITADQGPTRIRVGRNGTLVLGDGVEVAFGCVLAAERLLAIGPRTRLGPYVFAVDSNIGDPDLPDPNPLPIVIGSDVEIGSRVTLLKGAKIGPGSVVMAGSVVASRVSPGATVEGNPARIVRMKEMLAAFEPLMRQAWMRPEQPAIITDAGSLSYAGLWQRVADIARALHAAGVGSRENQAVLVWSADPVDFIASIYGVWLAGGVAVPVPEGAAPQTLAEMAQAVRARFLVLDAPIHQRVGDLLDTLVAQVIELELVPTHVDHLPFTGFERSRASGDPALILFTSGTTARKKAVLLSHASLLAATSNITTFMRLLPDVREFVSVPLYHSFGFGRVRAVLAVGGTLVLQAGPLNAPAMIAAIEKFDVNSLAAVPAALAIFQGRLAAMLERVGPRLKWVELGSAFLSEERKALLCQIFPNARICMHYGLTEASRSTFLEFHSERGQLATVGKPAPNVQILIVNEALLPCPALEEGEVVIFGSHLLTEYFGDPQRTAAAFTEAGGFRTGDFGFLDAEGYLHLRGRKDDMINKGGVKISPEELESAMRPLFPDLDFCVLGLPDPDGIAGMIPVVAHTGPEIVLADLIRQLALHVDKSKLPDKIVQVSRILRTENGKPQRPLIAQEIARQWQLALN